MYTSLVLMALNGLLIAPLSETVAWHHDYSAARQTGQTHQKPLAVFIGSGAGGYDKVCRDGKLSADLQKALLDNYICVYVDSTTPAGQQLATDFAVTRGTGLIISDRTGDRQAFYHDGELSEDDLSRWVNHFANPNVVVNTTMTNVSARLSMYPAGSAYSIYSNGANSSFGGIIYGNYCPGGT